MRYCFLDSGHHLGAIEAAAYASNYSYQLLFDFDQLALNDDLGFETKEFVTAAAIVGEPKQKTARRLRSPLAVVPGTDYFEPNRLIEAGYKQTLSSASSEVFRIASQTQLLQQPTFPVAPAQWLHAIQQRRSARRFYPHPIAYDAFLTVCKALQQPIPSEQIES